MSDTYDETGASAAVDAQPPAEATTGPSSDAPTATEPAPGSDVTPAPEPAPVEDPALKRFGSCRWHEKQDTGPSYCSHRDVLPFAGKNGFNASAWCEDCDFYKVKRTVKRRSSVDSYDDY